MPIAFVATNTLQELFGSLNLAACASFVPGGKLPYITAVSIPVVSSSRDTANISCLLKQTIQSLGWTFFNDWSALFSTSNLVNRLYFRISGVSPVVRHIAFIYQQ